MVKDYFLILVGETDTEINKLFIVEAEGISDALNKFDECSNNLYRKCQIKKLSRLSVVENLRETMVKPFSRNDVYALIP
ncbi:hypothetical protein ACEE21_14585 [Clostridium baratii]